MCARQLWHKQDAFGTAAIVHGRTTYLKGDGTPGAGRYTDVWAHVDGQWLCAAADVTRC